MTRRPISKLIRNVVLISLAVLLIFPMAVQAGTLIGNQLLIMGDTLWEKNPSVAYNFNQKQYLVVWYNDRAGNDDIRAQRLRSPNGELVGPDFYVSAGTGERRYPDVAYAGSIDDKYLVVWEQVEAGGTSIKGRIVSGLGVVEGTSDIVIRSAGGSTWTPAKPAVAYSYMTNTFLVVWAETWHPLPISYSIEGQMVTTSGALSGSSFTISSGSDERGEPDLANHFFPNRYLVVWQQKYGTTSWDIHGQQVNGDRSLYLGDILIFRASGPGTLPAVAAISNSPTTDKYLVVWEALYAPGDHNIIGRYIREDSTIGNWVFPGFTTGEDETAPAIAGSGTLKYFVTWHQSLGAVNNPIKGRAVDVSSGALLGQEAVFNGDDNRYPAVTIGSDGDFFTVWQDQCWICTNTDIRGQLWGNRVYLPVVKN